MKKRRFAFIFSVLSTLLLTSCVSSMDESPYKDLDATLIILPQ